MDSASKFGNEVDEFWVFDLKNCVFIINENASSHTFALWNVTVFEVEILKISFHSIEVHEWWLLFESFL